MILMTVFSLLRGFLVRVFLLRTRELPHGRWNHEFLTRSETEHDVNDIARDEVRGQLHEHDVFSTRFQDAFALRGDLESAIYLAHDRCSVVIGNGLVQLDQFSAFHSR
jgi:hypothetical protein